MFKDDFYKTHAEAKGGRGEPMLFKFTLEDDAETISMQASQLTNRLCQVTKKCTVSISRIVVAKIIDEDEKTYKFIGGDFEVFGPDACVFMHDGLEEGDYVAYVEWQWTDERRYNDGRFTIYGAEEDYEIEEYEDPNFLQKVLISSVNEQNLMKDAMKKVTGFTCYNGNEGLGAGFYISHWENTTDSTITVNHKMKDQKGYQLDSRFGSQPTLETVISPKDSLTLVHKRIENACKMSMSWSYKASK